MPAKTSWTPRTSREKDSVMALRFSWSPAYSSGRIKLAAGGETATPDKRDMTVDCGIGELLGIP